MDEIDAIGGQRFSEGTSADREIQWTLMEPLNQMDGFDRLGQVKTGQENWSVRDKITTVATSSGKILFWWLEIPLPNEQARLDIMKIHASPITKHDR